MGLGSIPVHVWSLVLGTAHAQVCQGGGEAYERMPLGTQAIPQRAGWVRAVENAEVELCNVSDARPQGSRNHGDAEMAEKRRQRTRDLRVSVAGGELPSPLVAASVGAGRRHVCWPHFLRRGSAVVPPWARGGTGDPERQAESLGGPFGLLGVPGGSDKTNPWGR